jgi:hypothetical protein
MTELMLSFFLLPFLLLRSNNKPIFSIYSWVWTIQSLFLLFYNKLVPLSLSALILLIAYIFPSAIALFVFENGKIIPTKDVEFKFHWPAIILSIVNIAIYFKILNSFDPSTLFEYYFNARLADKEGLNIYSDNPFLAQVQPFSFAYTVVWAFFIKRKSKLAIPILFGVLMVSSILLMTAYGARSGAFYYLFIVFSVLALKKYYSRKEFYLSSFVLFLIFIMTTFFMRTSGLEEKGGIISRLINDVVVYLFSGLPAFSEFLNFNYPVIDNDFAKVSNIYQPEQMFFLEVGDDIFTNVYTIFASYTYFFGGFGIFLYFFVNFISILFLSYFRGYFFAGLYIPFFVTSILLSPFQNYQFTFIPYYFRALFVYLIILNFSRIKFSFFKS